MARPDRCERFAAFATAAAKQLSYGATMRFLIVLVLVGAAPRLAFAGGA
jgi:hypothetical protein